MWGLAGPAAWSGHLLNVTGSVVFDGAGSVLWVGLSRGAGPEVVAGPEAAEALVGSVVCASWQTEVRVEAGICLCELHVNTVETIVSAYRTRLDLKQQRSR